MRVVVPYTSLRPETVAALDASGQAHEAVRVHGDDGYYALLSGLWSAGGAFTVVEQDIVVSPGTLPALAACPRDWCSFGFPYMGAENYHGLGCAKFSGALMARVPGALERAGRMSDETHPPGHWCRLDAWLSVVLREAGEQRCEHKPPVGHLNRYPAHGCVPA